MRQHHCRTSTAIRASLIAVKRMIYVTYRSILAISFVQPIFYVPTNKTSRMYFMYLFTWLLFGWSSSSCGGWRWWIGWHEENNLLLGFLFFWPDSGHSFDHFFHFFFFFLVFFFVFFGYFLFFFQRLFSYMLRMLLPAEHRWFNGPQWWLYFFFLFLHVLFVIWMWMANECLSVDMSFDEQFACSMNRTMFTMLQFMRWYPILGRVDGRSHRECVMWKYHYDM